MCIRDRNEVAQWEADNPRVYWAAGANRGPVDVVWRQAFRAELGTRKGEFSASLYWDFRKYYAHIGLGFLW
eukprot:4460406-Pyramimonas_sp.AAC.1